MSTINGTSGDDTLYGTDGIDSIFGFAGNDTLYGHDGNDTIKGGFGRDSLYGESGNDSLLGEEGEDSLYGGYGLDILNGGSGDDYMEGGHGADTYILTKAGGEDRIYNYDSDSSIDVAKFTDVATTDVTGITRYSNDLVLTYGALGGQLTVENYFNNAAYQVDTFDFTNLDWTVANIKSKVITKGTESGDSINGYNGGPNKIYAYGGNDTIYGGDGNDSLDGGTGNDTLRGNDGNDSLLGQNGEDSLYGDNGNDSLNGGAGDDRLEGGQGADTYILTKDGGQDRINNNDSDDSSIDVAKFTDVATTDVTGITRYSNDLVLTYGAFYGQLTVENYFNDATYRVDTFDFTDLDWTVANIKSNVITKGTESGDYINGYNSGPNKIYAYGGNDTIYGGDGNDSLDGGTGNDTLSGNDGNDSMNGQSGADQLYGNNGNDIMNGSTGDDYLEGGQGADTYILTKAGGQDRINNYDSDSGIDVAKFTDAATTDVTGITRYSNDLVLTYGALGGQLTLENYFSSDSYQVDTFDFTNLDWTLTDITNKVITKGTERGDNISGYNGGTNKIFAYGGNDSIYGGDGNDFLYGGTGNDTLRGNDGNDSMLGQNGADTLYGDNGNDGLNGGAGDDRLEGGQGADTYLIAKGDGHDVIYNYDSDSAVDLIMFTNVALCDLTGATQVGNDFVLSYGTDSQVTVQYHFYGANYQVGKYIFSDGPMINNVVMGSTGDDSLSGTATTNDLIVGAGGVDTMTGLAGDDVYQTNGGDTIVEAASAGTDTVLSSATLTLGDNLENLVLLTGAVNGIGNSLNNKLCGNAANNILNGLIGDDTLNGGLGNDILSGGAGADYFDFTTELNATTNKDTIFDFNVVDTIRLENGIMTGLGTTTGVLAVGAFHSGTVNTATEADDRIIYNTSTGALFYDADGTGLTAAVQIATIGITTHPALTNADFMVI